jgi:hypothetical protein
MIPKTGDVVAFDVNNIPTLKKILDDFATNTERTIYMDTVPTITDLEIGTKCIYDNGTGVYRMYYVTAKNNLAYLELGGPGPAGPTGPAGPGAGKYPPFGLHDADGDTIVQVEESTDEDIIRFDTGNTQGGTAGERMTLDVNGLAMTTDLPVIFDGRGNNTKVKWNTATVYWEIYIQNSLRAQF